MFFKCFALFLGYEHDFMRLKISSSLACDIAKGVGNDFIRAGVIILTRLSVHCAERITATNKSNGEEYVSSVFGAGEYSSNFCMQYEYFSARVIFYEN